MSVSEIQKRISKAYMLGEVLILNIIENHDIILNHENYKALHKFKNRRNDILKL